MNIVLRFMKWMSLFFFMGINIFSSYSQTQIEDAAGLAAISEDLNGSYQLVSDLILDKDWTPIAGFTGTFDGGGHIISGLSYNNTSGESVALFASTHNATIKNVGIEKARIIGKKDVAALIGVMAGGILEQCYVSNSYIQGSDHVASLVGQAIAGSTQALVRNCYASAQVYATTNNIGGLVASAKACTVSKCYFSGVIRGAGSRQQSGGLVGFIENGYTPSVEYSVNLAPFIISNGGTSMRIIPNIGRNATLTQNYSLSTSLLGTSYALSALSTVDTSNTYYGTSAKNGGNLPSDDDALSQAFYVNTLSWDFTEVWKMLDDGYPVLKWQSLPVNATILNANSPSDLSILDVTASGLRSGNQIDFSHLISSHGIDLNISTDNDKILLSDAKIAALKSDVIITTDEEATFNVTSTSSQFTLSNPLTTVELVPGIPFTELEAYPYPDGNISKIYNSGPGLAIDKTNTTSEDSKMVVISSTTEASFTSYIQLLLLNGFVQISTRHIEENIFYTLEKDEQLYYLYYTASKKQVRIIQDNSTRTMLDKLDATQQGDGETEFYLYSLDYTQLEGQTSKTDYWEIDCGAMLIMKLKDNSLFIVDAGHERQSSKAALEGLLNFMYDITGQEEGQEITIRAWFYSHAHGDHVYMTYPFLEKYHDLLNVESVLFNIPSYQTMSSGYDAGTFLMKQTYNTYYPSCNYVKLYTGQQFSLQGVLFDVLFTHDDAVSADGISSIRNFNETSTILRITMDGKTIMLLGDTDGIGESNLLSMYSDSTLHSDCVQTTHHGYNYVPSLYKAIGAPIALFCNSRENAKDNNAAKYLPVVNAAENVKTVFAYPHTYRLTVENDTIKTDIIPSYRSYFKTLDLPDLHAQAMSAGGSQVNISTVLNEDALSDFVIDKSVTGTRSISSSESCSLILDGTTATKYCTDTIPVTIAWSMKKAVVLKGYIIYTANDNAASPGRNPQEWVLSASNDGLIWTNIDSVTNANLPDVNYTGVGFLIENNKPYQYYAIKVFSTGGNSILQFSEIRLFGSEEIEMSLFQPLEKRSEVSVLSTGKQEITIKYDGNLSSSPVMKLYNLKGQEVMSRVITNEYTVVNVSESGCFIVDVQGAESEIAQKIRIY